MNSSLYFLILLCVLSKLSTAQESRHITTGPADIAYIDTAYIKTFISATDQIEKIYADSIVRRYKHALRMSRSISYDEASAYCAAKIGAYYFSNKKDYIQSRVYLYNTLSYLKKLPKKHYWLIPDVYNLLGGVHFKTGYNDSAILYYNMALWAMDSLSLNRPKVRATVYTNIGSVLADSKQYQQGANYIKKSIAFINENRPLNYEDSTQLALNYKNLGALYANRLNDMDSANYWWLFAINLYQRLSMKTDLQEIYSNIAMGWFMVTHQDIEKADRYLDTAIQIDPEVAGTDINIQLNLSQSFYYKGFYFDAITHGKKAIALCEASGLRERKEIAYETLSYCYAFLGDTFNSHKYQRLSLLLSDSLLNEEVSRSIAQVEVQHRIADKDKALAENKAALYQQRYWLIASISCALMLLLSLLAFLRTSRQKRRLHQEQLQNLQQQKKIEHLQVTMEAQELERKRIARDLHDGIGVLLSAAKINHTLLGKVLAPACSDVFAYRQSKEILQQMQQEIRTIAHNLVPDYITHKSFEEALAALAKKINDPGIFSINIYSYGQLRDLHPERSFALYRVIEEIMHNAVKHSDGTELLIQLIYHQDQLHITIEDNGKGFDPNLPHTGMGLHNIKNRVELLKGFISLASDKEQGTIYTLEIPY